MTALLPEGPRCLRRLNLVLLAAMLALIAIGVVFINSACATRDDPALRRLYLRHAEYAAAGLAAYLALAWANYRSLLRWSWLPYLGGLVLLAAVLAVGKSYGMGARRWVFGIQPSEVAKLATVLLVALLLGRRNASRGLGTYAAVLGLTAVPVGLVLLQPDLGTALVFVPTIGAMLFAADVAPRAFWTTLAAGAVAAAWVVSAVAFAETLHLDRQTRERRLHWATGLRPFQQERLAHFLFPDRDKSGLRGTWNKRQSEIAVGSGALWGKGFRQGDQNLLGYLPQKVSFNDFIFSVLAEEAGFAGAVVVLALYGAAILAALVVAGGCPDNVGKLLCVGVATQMFCQVFVNIAMTVGLLPITGLPLPFISSGCTSLLTMMAALGFVQSVAIHGRRAAPRF